MACRTRLHEPRGSQERRSSERNAALQASSSSDVQGKQAWAKPTRQMRIAKPGADTPFSVISIDAL